MSIQMLGIDHSRAPVDVRAIFSFTKKNAAAAMDSLKKDCGVEGCIILSTCNRMEIWVSAPEDWKGFPAGGALPDQGGGSHGIRGVLCGTQRGGGSGSSVSSGLRPEIHDPGRGSDPDSGGGRPGPGQRFYMTDSVLEVLFRKAVDGGQAGQDRRGVQPGQRDRHGPGGGEC